jgi:uncharacterized Zn finger protein (UPF0148 family)
MMLSNACPNCGSVSFEVIQGQAICRSCGFTWQIGNSQQTAPTAVAHEPGMVSRKISSGRLRPVDDSSIFHSEEVIRESGSGIETESIKEFTRTRSGLLVHDEQQILALCSQCSGLVHVSEFGKCQIHPNEILCACCQYILRDGRVVCKRAYYRNLTLSILLFPFKIFFVFLREIASLLFLKA